MRLFISPTPADAGRLAARYLALLVRKRESEGKRFRMALSGGSTAAFLLNALQQCELPWSIVDVFQVDERCAAAGSSARNLTELERVLVRNGPLRHDHLYPLPALENVSPESVTFWEQSLREMLGTPPVFDAIHLGLGDDGHTASLVPGDAVLSQADRYLSITASYNGHRRITLTAATLNAARRRVWLITGKSKSTMLPRLLKHDSRIPGGTIASRQSVVFADCEAASAL